ncbi:MAG: response regulator, partial [Myxococcota bacterium]
MTHAERVLFVDDDRPVRVAFARSLRGSGLAIDVASGADEALALARTSSYAVIASDYRMPEVDGLQLIERLRTLQPDTTYVLVSGELDLDLAIKAVNDHDVPHVLCKPWDIDELRALLTRSVAAYWLRVGQRRASDLAATELEAARRQKEKLEEVLRRSSSNLAEMVLGALDVRHHESQAHCRRVAAYARLLADELKIDCT